MPVNYNGKDGAAVPEVEGKVDNFVTAFRDRFFTIKRYQSQLDSIEGSTVAEIKSPETDRDHAYSFSRKQENGTNY